MAVQAPPQRSPRYADWHLDDLETLFAKLQEQREELAAFYGPRLEQTRIGRELTDTLRGVYEAICRRARLGAHL